MKHESEVLMPFLRRVDESQLRTGPIDSRLVTLTQPASMAAEQFRMLFYRLEKQLAAQEKRIISFTSALPREGKTLTSINLALAASRANPHRKSLLFDADFRRNQVSQYLGIRARPGATDVLNEDAPLKEAIKRFRSTSLYVLPAGETLQDPTPVLARAPMSKLFEKLAEQFDDIYVDLPPALLFSDATLVGTLTHGVVLVVRANQTPQSMVAQAVERLGGVNLLGCVLNGVEDSLSPYLAQYLNIR